MEGWMKLLACSSYDYMKLMVVELQHQLLELEEEERQATASRATADDKNPPRAPPRNRHNPFNEGEHKSGRSSSKRRWAELHAQHSVKILVDRAKWQQEREAKHTIEMKDDQLLVTM